MKKQKVLLAMSGGVDSSVAALLLKKQGYEVIGAFMKSWSNEPEDLSDCPWKVEREYAVKISKILKIPLITFDFEKQYRKEIVDEMFKDYKKGITPNPDIECNNKIKFPLLIKEAKKLKCDFIATGHYARINKNKNKYELLRAKDELKDQSYFLYRIKQNELKNALFPIGEYTKKQIREIAGKNNFPNYNKKGTVGICFIGKINLKEFLQKKIKPKRGIILDPEGNKLGEHDGIFYYTIGQRIGSRYGIEISKPEKMQKKWYVARKIPETNIIIAAPEGHKLNFRKEIIIKNPYWISEKPKNNSRVLYSNPRSIKSPSRPAKVLARIRQVGELLPSVLQYKNKKYKIILNKAITGVSQGQAIVLYQGEKCLGGGVIGFES